jgi:HemY protein
VKLLGVFLAALAAAVLLGQGLSGAHGVIAIQVGDRLIRTSVGVGIILALVLAAATFFIARNLWRLVTFRRRYRQWKLLRARRTSHARLNEGVLALAAGEYARAERLLASPDLRAGGSAAHYLAAAQAAQAQDAPQRRDAYLAMARELAPRQGLPLALQQIEMQLAAGEFAAAEKSLEALNGRYRSNPQVLALQHRCFAANDRWEDLVKLLPRLKRANVYPGERLAELEAECATRILGRPCASRQALDEVWTDLPRQVRSLPVVIAGYARVLLHLNEQVDAEAVLRAALKTQWDPRLVALYGDVRSPAATTALQQAEHWLRDHQEDPGLLLSLGHLCLTERLWGKAREYLEAALAKVPSALTHRLLAEALEQLGDHAAAAHQRRLGLELLTGPSPTRALARP